MDNAVVRALIRGSGGGAHVLWDTEASGTGGASGVAQSPLFSLAIHNTRGAGSKRRGNTGREGSGRSWNSPWGVRYADHRSREEQAIAREETRVS